MPSESTPGPCPAHVDEGKHRDRAGRRLGPEGGPLGRHRAGRFRARRAARRKQATASAAITATAYDACCPWPPVRSQARGLGSSSHSSITVAEIKRPTRMNTRSTRSSRRRSGRRALTWTESQRHEIRAADLQTLRAEFSTIDIHPSPKRRGTSKLPRWHRLTDFARAGFPRDGRRTPSRCPANIERGSTPKRPSACSRYAPFCRLHGIAIGLHALLAIAITREPALVALPTRRAPR